MLQPVWSLSTDGMRPSCSFRKFGLFIDVFNEIFDERVYGPAQKQAHIINTEAIALVNSMFNFPVNAGRCN